MDTPQQVIADHFCDYYDAEDGPWDLRASDVLDRLAAAGFRVCGEGQANLNGEVVQIEHAEAMFLHRSDYMGIGYTQVQVAERELDHDYDGMTRELVDWPSGHPLPDGAVPLWRVVSGVEGYRTGHHLDVEPVCTTCHHAREARRGA